MPHSNTTIPEKNSFYISFLPFYLQNKRYNTPWIVTLFSNGNTSFDIDIKEGRYTTVNTI